MSERVCSQHLDRAAIVYARQSSMGQVRMHTESTRLQLGLRERANVLGWSRPQLVCDDLGISAGGFSERPGFQKLVTEVSLNRVGIILCWEASRLSRNSKDWAQLFELCGHVDTLVADFDQVYDLSIANDRLLLGIKGSVSEYELALLRQRSAEAIDAKARRGELKFELPAGLTWNHGKVELAADHRAQQAVRMVFDKFDELGSARKVLIWFRDEGLQLPASQRGTAALRWCTPTYRLVLSVLRSPLYAGAYAWGRTGVRTRIVEGKPERVRARKPMDQWKVLIAEHHEGYISWEQFEHNQRVLADNAFMTKTNGHKSARGGRLLLAGLLRCARCGHMLHVVYERRGGGGRYQCRQLNKARAAPRCISFAARRVDSAVEDVLLQSVQGKALDAAVQSAGLVAQREQQQHQAVQLELEQARYEAQLAQRRYESVDPDQRLVAAELEKRWNTALERVKQLEDKLAVQAAPSQRQHVVERERLESLAQDLQAVWELTDAMALKQRIVRTLMQEIVVDIDDDERRVVLLVHWVGGRHTRLCVARRRVGEHGNATSHDADSVVRTMAGQWPDSDIAATLNRLGLRTGVGNTWTAARVLSVRKRLRLVDFDPSKAKPRLTLNQAADALGVGPWVVKSLVKRGVIEASQAVARAPWSIEPAQLDTERVRQAVQAVQERKPRPASNTSTQLNLLIPKT